MAQGSLLDIVTASQLSPPAYPVGRFAGRGIVICAGGPRYFTCAFVLLHLLRHALGCQLPVQIWHLGAQELSPAMIGLLQGLGAEVVDAEPLLSRYPASIRNGWALKPFAAMHSRFAEVLGLDADAVPLVSPEVVFDWPQYLHSGALFWPDIADLAAANPVWHLLGLEPRREISFDTGQFVLDKKRCWAALMLTVALNSESESLYRMIHGEKDSFLLAFLCCNQPFHVMEHRPLLFDSDLIQLDPSGSPFTHHRTYSKFLFNGRNRVMYGDTLTAAADAAVQALRAHWTGVVFHPPAMSALAQKTAAQLAGQNFVYHISSGQTRAMRLAADFQVALGRAEFEQHWAVIERDGALVLQLFSATRLSIELSLQPDGSWQGASSVGNGFSATLVAETAAESIRFAAADRVPSSGPIVAELLTGAGLGAGFDERVLGQLRSAFELLNNVYFDAPEALLVWLNAHRSMADDWYGGLQSLAENLKAERDARAEAVRPVAAPMDTLRPGLYHRIA